MAASDHLGPQFNSIVSDYHDNAEYPTERHANSGKKGWGHGLSTPHDLLDPEVATGSCGAVTDHFDSWVKHNTGNDVTHKQEHVGRKHQFNSYNGQAVDWTARQFFPNASVPHVEPLDQYKAKLQKHFRTKQYKETLSQRSAKFREASHD